MKKEILRFGKTAVWINVIGVLLSGLLFPVLSAIFCPQPEWKNTELFIKSFNSVQTLTFFFGFMLVVGSLMTFIALFTIAEKHRHYALTALVINSIFTVIVCLNYIIQTTYVPYLAVNYPSETGYILPMLSMSNPGSFAWALEMYGWGGIGLSFIFMAKIFINKKHKTLRALFIINAVCSVASALMTSVDMKWLFSSAGFASLIIWNLLVLIIDGFLLKYFDSEIIKEHERNRNVRQK